MQKFVNLVDLVKSFPTTIYLQRFVSIQPRTSLSKFAKNSPKVRKKLETSKAETKDGAVVAGLAMKTIGRDRQPVGIFLTFIGADPAGTGAGSPLGCLQC